MDSEQKSTEEIQTLKFDIYFMEDLTKFSDSEQESILNQLIEYEEFLPEKDGMTQEVSGVVHSEEPLYFEIEYLKQEGEKALFLEISAIGLDKFLDSINENKSIKSNEHSRTNNKTGDNNREV